MHIAGNVVMYRAVLVYVLGEDGCQELIEDTAEMQKAWIEKMMEKGLCSCDEEHMFDCPSAARSDAGAKPGSQVDVEQQAFDDVLDRILGEKVRSENNWLKHSMNGDYSVISGSQCAGAIARTRQISVSASVLSLMYFFKHSDISLGFSLGLSFKPLDAFCISGLID